MAITVEIEKRPLPNFSPSKYCEWCVTVRTDDPNGFRNVDGNRGPLQWALDFPEGTDILDPDQARKIKGAPTYTTDPLPGTGTITVPSQREATICFVAACQDRENTDMSLENRVDYPPGAVLAPREWRPQPFEGGPDGVGKIVGPAPVAMSTPRRSDDIAFVAEYEARKLAALLGLPPRLAEPKRVTPAHRVQVSGMTTPDEASRQRESAT